MRRRGESHGLDLSPALNVGPTEDTAADWIFEKGIQAGVERAGAVKASFLLWGERDDERTEVGLVLVEGRRAEKHRGNGGLGENPGEGELGEGHLRFVGDLAQGVEDGPVALCEAAHGVIFGLIETAAGIRGLPGTVAGIFAGEEAGAERAPGHKTETEVAGSGKVFLFDGAVDERVGQLQRDWAGDAMSLGESGHAGDVPGGYVGKAEITDFAGADKSDQAF